MQEETGQAEAVAFLGDGAGLGHPAERIDTHGAIVFLIGDRALKMKRAVTYDYMDLSTVEKRRTLLEREFALNRRAAPSIYRAVIPVTREPDGPLALDGEGEAVEWLLSMRRFPPEAELTHVARAHGISDALAQDLGRAVARYHRDAPVKDADGATLLGEVLDELERVFAGMAGDIDAQDIIRQGRAMLSARAKTLRARTGAGLIRRCHGDLHLRNIVLLDGVPTPFDALEFDERLATCDTLYDLAFLLMDLLHRGFAHPANMVLNTYMGEMPHDMADAGLDILPLCLALRASIRAMVALQTADVATGADDEGEEASAYLTEARAYLSPPPPVLLAIGGFSGSGKTTIARAIAHQIGPSPGAIHLRSDVTRKRLMGVEPQAPLGSEGYTSDISAQTYRAIRQQAAQILSQSHAALLDAVHSDADDRAAAARIAEDASCRFVGIWLETPLATRRSRVAGRGPDASDADTQVVEQQEQADPGPVGWHRIDAGRSIDAITAEIAALLTKDPDTNA